MTYTDQQVHVRCGSRHPNGGTYTCLREPDHRGPHKDRLGREFYHDHERRLGSYTGAADPRPLTQRLKDEADYAEKWAQDPTQWEPPSRIWVLLREAAEALETGVFLVEHYEAALTIIKRRDIVEGVRADALK